MGDKKDYFSSEDFKYESGDGEIMSLKEFIDLKRGENELVERLASQEIYIKYVKSDGPVSKEQEYATGIDNNDTSHTTIGEVLRWAGFNPTYPEEYYPIIEQLLKGRPEGHIAFPTLPDEYVVKITFRDLLDETAYLPNGKALSFDKMFEGSYENFKQAVLEKEKTSDITGVRRKVGFEEVFPNNGFLPVENFLALYRQPDEKLEGIEKALGVRGLISEEDVAKSKEIARQAMNAIEQVLDMLIPGDFSFSNKLGELTPSPANANAQRTGGSKEAEI